MSLTLGEGVACNTIFSWPFKKNIKSSIMTKNSALVSELLVEQFNMYMMDPQRARGSPNTSE